MTARSRETVEKLRLLGLESTNCNRCAVEKARVVFIAVKPYQFPVVAREISSVVKGRIVVSVMAAIPHRLLSRALPGAEIYRTMPNLNIRIRRSLTALYAPEDAANKELVKRLLECFGSVYEIPEELMDAWTAVAGSGPALVAEFLDAIVLASLSVGLPRDVARRVAAELLESTAHYLLEHPDVHPSELRDEVTTPAGTTIAAIRILESKGFKSAVIDAVRDATKRAVDLAKEIEEKVRQAGGF
ncbi:pyrroline-5-carboxylate reductase [Pyrofollis japonicus]|nr:pyrroline-5-carboxylate reductase [Pyrofollis japonicus]